MICIGFHRFLRFSSILGDDGKRWYSDGRFSALAKREEGLGGGGAKIQRDWEFGAHAGFLFGSSRGLQKCGRRYTLDTFREKQAPRSRFLKSPKGSKSMAGMTK